MLGVAGVSWIYPCILVLRWEADYVENDAMSNGYHVCYGHMAFWAFTLCPCPSLCRSVPSAPTKRPPLF